MSTVKELSIEVEALKAQVADLQAQLLQTQKECLAAVAAMQPVLVASVVEALKPLRETRAVVQTMHLDRERRIAAVARLSAKFPDAHSFTAAQVQAEMAEAA